MTAKVLLSRALEAVHHLADDAPPWKAVLQSASALLGTDGAVLIVQQHGRVDMQHVGADPAAVRDYAAHFHTQDVLLAPGMNHPVGSWLETGRVLPAGQLERTAYYNDFMCRHRMRQMGSVLLSRDSPQQWSSLGLQRETHDDRLQARMEGPAVRTYLQALHGALRARQARAAQWLLTAQAMLDDPSQATVLVAPDGAIVHASDASRGRLTAHGWLRAEALWHPSPAVRAQLRTNLSQAARSGARPVLRVSDGRGGAFRLSFVRAAPLLCPLGEMLMLVRIERPAPDASMQVLQQSFGITTAEARVLQGLVDGRVAKEIAQAQSVSIHTVRKQIATLLHKMDCTRQLELVQKAMALLRG